MRNYLCPHYDRCLTRAARENQPDLPCRWCPFEHDRGGGQSTFGDLPGIIALLAVVFDPDGGANVSGTLETIRGSLIQHLALLTGERPAPWEAEYSIHNI